MERPHDGLRIAVNDGQQDTSRSVGNTPTLFPILQGAHLQTETVCELLSAQPQSLAKGDNPLSGRIVDNSARKFRLPADMGKNLTKGGFDLVAEFRASCCHFSLPSVFIVATTVENALISAEVRSLRSDFAYVVSR